MSARANRRFGGEKRLPMQWSLNGSVNWTAPRLVALAFNPVLGTLCLFGFAAMASFSQPRAGQEDLVIPANIFVAVVIIGTHAFHLWLIERTLRNKT
ncbi:MAG: hypothetical protein ABIW58_05795 [Sphingomicrobium sp.]